MRRTSRSNAIVASVASLFASLVTAATDTSTDGRVSALGGPTPLTFAALVEPLRGSLGRSPFSLQLPAFLGRPFIKLGKLIMDDPPLPVDHFAALSVGGTCDPNPAAVTFGLRMRSLVDVLPEYRRAN